MNGAELINANAHFDPVKAQREAAEEYLKKGVALAGFTQGLLQVATTNDLPHIRLAASVQLKTLFESTGLPLKTISNQIAIAPRES